MGSEVTAVGGRGLEVGESPSVVAPPLFAVGVDGAGEVGDSLEVACGHNENKKKKRLQCIKRRVLR